MIKHRRVIREYLIIDRAERSPHAYMFLPRKPRTIVEAVFDAGCVPRGVTEGREWNARDLNPDNDGIFLRKTLRLPDDN